jgi:hypothetical protein
MSIDVGGYLGDDGGRSSETGRINFASMQLTLVRIESKFDALSRDIGYMRESQMARANENEVKFRDHELRLRNIEAKRYIEPRSITTVFAVVLPVCAIVVSIIAIIVK